KCEGDSCASRASTVIDGCGSTDSTSRSRARHKRRKPTCLRSMDCLVWWRSGAASKPTRRRDDFPRRDPRYDARMPHPSWNDSYASGEPLPWDTGMPDPMLVEMIESCAIAPGRALEVGCGTGTNAIYLAQHGFEVTGVDISPLAVENARAKSHGCCRF